MGMAADDPVLRIYPEDSNDDCPESQILQAKVTDRRYKSQGRDGALRRPVIATR